MVSLVLFILATIGLTNILVHGKILDDNHLGWRSWMKRQLGSYQDLLDCYECTGFWAGMLLGFIVLLSEWLWAPLLFLIVPFAGSAIGHFYSDISYLIQSKTDFVVSDEHDEPDQQ
jgi:hypothetical protein